MQALCWFAFFLFALHFALTKMFEETYLKQERFVLAHGFRDSSSLSFGPVSGCLCGGMAFRQRAGSGGKAEEGGRVGSKERLVR